MSTPPLSRIPHSSGQLSVLAPSVDSLAHPVYAGFLFKRGVNFYCIEEWRKRFCILQSGYLFKYEEEHGTTPKGVPIHVSDCTIELVKFDELHDRKRNHRDMIEHVKVDSILVDVESLDAANESNMSWVESYGLFKERAFSWVIRLTNLTQEYLFAAETKIECQNFAKILVEHKRLIIKKLMGHAQMTQDEQFAATCGDAMVKNALDHEAEQIPDLWGVGSSGPVQFA